MSTKILFTGDSITDAGRTLALRGLEAMFPRQPGPPNPMQQQMTDKTLGDGYPCLVNARLAADCPNKYLVLNRGISGHRISDMYARIKRDLINLAPDVLSIMIGINDVWHECSFKNGVDNDHFTRLYDMFLEEIKAALPDMKLIILEPYVFHGRATAENWDYFREETKLRIQANRDLAAKYKADVLINTQALFEKACADTGTESAYWAYDGVHPTPAGHQLLADTWLKEFKKLGI